MARAAALEPAYGAGLASAYGVINFFLDVFSADLTELLKFIHKSADT
jgi:hypothetical protein